MLENLKLKKILPLAAACLLVASGVYAGGPDEPDHREGVSRRKASDLELKGQSSKRQKPTGDQEGEEDRTLSSLESLPQDVWMLLLDFLSPSDLLNMRETSNRLRAVASQREPWQSKYPLFNLSQSWQNGPDVNSFLNTTLNIVVHRILMELGAVRFEIFYPGLQNAEKFSINVRQLAEIDDLYGFVKGFCDYFNKISTNTQDSQGLADWMETPEVKSLEKKGNAEKRLLQFFHFMLGTSCDKTSLLYVAPRPGEPKPFVELISNELALRERIKNAPEAELPQLYDQLLTDGVYVTTQDFRYAGAACFNVRQFQKAAAYYEAVLARMGVDATTQDFRDAGESRFRSKQYEQAAAHFEDVLTRPNAKTKDFRNAGESRFRAQQYEQAAAHFEAVLTRPDATTQDFRYAGLARFNAQQYPQAAEYYETVLARPDATTQDFKKAVLARLNAGQFQQVAALYETVLGREDVTTEDFRNAGLARFQAKQYEQAADHFEAVLTRKDATTQDFRYAGLARYQAKHYEQATAHYEAVLGREDETTYDSKKAKESRLRTQKHEQPQPKFDVISYSPDHAYLDLDEVERPRLKIGQAKKKK